MRPRVYLAGPDVFFPEPEQWAARKQLICERHGLAGVSPLDALDSEPADWGGYPLWRRIALRNEAHIRSCHGMIANLTPFRGPSADVGTVYEVGFARALGLPVFGYATTTELFLERCLRCIGEGASADADGSWRDVDGLLVEQFGLFDNLMIQAGLIDSGGELITGDAGKWDDLTLFERAVVSCAALLAGRGTGP